MLSLYRLLLQSSSMLCGAENIFFIVMSEGNVPCFAEEASNDSQKL